MAAATQSRDTTRMGDSAVIELIPAPMLASVSVFAGTIAVVDATGYFTKGGVSATQRAVGIYLNDVVAGGSNGATVTTVRRGTYRFNNSSAGDLIAQVDVFTNCYIVDDNTVAKTSGGSTRSVAGKIIAVDSTGVWVQLGTP